MVKGDIYSITGFYNNGFPRATIPFGGFFLASDIGTSLGLEIRGELTDIYGRSSISGLLAGDRMGFGKRYGDRDYEIQYKFQKNENGLWLGTYASEDTGKNKAVCKLDCAFKGIVLIEGEQMDPEQWAKDLLESMVEQGMLEIVPEPGKNQNPGH